ncbi:MAG: hypothetical protein KF782_12645 [Labilithrix sp.]|nr:hypothetical protein [Labilithrix sp.]
MRENGELVAAWSVRGEPIPPYHLIHIERFKGPVLLVAGEKDDVWPSAEAALHLNAHLVAAGRTADVLVLTRSPTAKPATARSTLRRRRGAQRTSERLRQEERCLHVEVRDRHREREGGGVRDAEHTEERAEKNTGDVLVDDFASATTRSIGSARSVAWCSR